MNRLLIVRHGPTEWSVSGRHTGRTDIPLTDHGRETVTALRPWIQGWQPVVVLSSPLVRAWETAKLAGWDPTEEADLMEWDYGRYEGVTTPEIQERRAAAGEPPWSLWTDGCPGGESATDVGARCDRVLARAQESLPAGDVALVAHGHVLRVLTARWLQLHPSQGSLLMLDAGTASVLTHEHGVPVVRVWNAGPSALLA